MDVCVDVCFDVFLDVCVDVCVDVCADVCDDACVGLEVDGGLSVFFALLELFTPSSLSAERLLRSPGFVWDFSRRSLRMPGFQSIPRLGPAFRPSL